MTTRRPALTICLLAGAMLAGCAGGTVDVQRALKDVNVIDESNLNDIMASAADPGEAVLYFRRSADAEPDRIALQRGLGRALVRDGQAAQGAAVWSRVVRMPGATSEDGIDYADALIRTNDWAGAAAQLNTIPPTYETYRRYRLEAMVADSNRQWNKADSFYQTAAGLTSKPAPVLNNWGYSKLTRGEYAAAERLFAEAVESEPDLFTAKNNLVMARGAQRKYDLPVMSMSQTEQAQLLHTLALTAIKQGDVSIGRGLLEEAVAAHPQHFESAARALAALEGNAIGRS
ncbi:tetratricopeptide region [Oceaniovalibus guishaninsula JLT2003]|uniref:Tetratricopeptide region n=1 Tax=Oceaniovalibus guishaninsula JLT2003 TaxID=1231392 RepID=K2HNI7_9RHOB|nr:tetratricopeptide repeat protein [Oceaniovalibus guishaninsula]EKE44434.1 tetratricopeptide region [Oceaniovalibus guishaninsula JLT2003]